jgi:hypothetical protein
MTKLKEVVAAKLLACETALQTRWLEWITTNRGVQPRITATGPHRADEFGTGNQFQTALHPTECLSVCSVRPNLSGPASDSYERDSRQIVAQSLCLQLCVCSSSELRIGRISSGVLASPRTATLGGPNACHTARVDFVRDVDYIAARRLRTTSGIST